MRNERDGLIEVSNLWKSYRGEYALRDVSLAFEPGRITGLLGPNGAGKTTLMKTMVDIAAKNAGEVHFGGETFSQIPRGRGGASIFFESWAFHPMRKVGAQLRIAADVLGQPAQTVSEVLELVGLGNHAKKYIGQLSLGMKRRLVLGQVILSEPRYVLLDEPLNGLDPNATQWFRQLVRDLADKGATVVISSHLLNEAERFVDDIALLDHGTCIYNGSLEAWRETAEPVVLFTGLHAEPLVDAATSDGIHVERPTSTTLSVPVSWSERAKHLIATYKLDLVEIGVTQPSLESLFAQSTRVSSTLTQAAATEEENVNADYTSFRAMK